MLRKWKDLNNTTKKEIRRVYVHYKLDNNFKYFDAWAETHAFYVKKDGTLDARYNHCEPHYLAD